MEKVLTYLKETPLDDDCCHVVWRYKDNTTIIEYNRSSIEGLEDCMVAKMDKNGLWHKELI